MGSSHDTCPKCGGRKRSKNRQCARCRGYGERRSVRPDGYVRLYVPGHPVAHSDGQALEHRYVLHEAGVVVPDGWHIHHIDGDRANNALDNLAVVRPRGHQRLHLRESPFVENQHGTFAVTEHGNGGYTRGCRCDVCRRANTERCMAYRRRRRQQGAAA